METDQLYAYWRDTLYHLEVWRVGLPNDPGYTPELMHSFADSPLAQTWEQSGGGIALDGGTMTFLQDVGTIDWTPNKPMEQVLAEVRAY